MKKHLKTALIIGSSFSLGIISGILLAPDKASNTYKKLKNKFNLSLNKTLHLSKYIEKQIEYINSNISKIKNEKNKDIVRKTISKIEKQINKLLKTTRKYKNPKYEEMVFLFKEKSSNEITHILNNLN